MECAWDLRADLGEGPIYRAADKCVWFVDIKRHEVLCFDTRTNAGKSWSAPAQCSFIAPVRDGCFVVGLQTGLHRFDPNTGAFDLIRTVEPDQSGNRLNDAFVDPKGRLWFGSMDDACADPTGALYRWEGGDLARCDDGYAITNGPCVSVDGRTFYHTDTYNGVIYAFDLAPNGALSNKRPFITRFERGGPDGSVVDAEDHLWVALWGGWGVNRYAPDGSLVAHIEMPVPQVTKVAFGGDDLRTMFITTARADLSAEDVARAPLSGGLFRLAVETPGLPQSELAIW